MNAFAALKQQIRRQERVKSDGVDNDNLENNFGIIRDESEHTLELRQRFKNRRQGSHLRQNIINKFIILKMLTFKGSFNGDYLF